MKNKKEFLEQIERYKRVDEQEIEETSQKFEDYSDEDWGAAIMQEIMGFNSMGTCILCLAVKDFNKSANRTFTNCNKCAYVVLTGDKCFNGINEKTYKAIEHAIEEDELLDAVHARTVHMEDIYKHPK